MRKKKRQRSAHESKRVLTFKPLSYPTAAKDPSSLSEQYTCMPLIVTSPVNNRLPLLPSHTYK